MTTDTLTDILGADFWTAQFPTAAAARKHACDRMAAGRPAVNWTDADGRHFAGWGVKVA